MRRPIIIRRIAVILVFSFAVVALALADGGTPAWRMPGIPEGANIPTTPFSAARWIWSGPRIGVGHTVYLRCHFNAPEDYTPDSRTKLQIRVDDFTEAIYLNGNKASVGGFAKAVRPGGNVFALQVRNAHGPGGALFRIFVGQADGSVRIYPSCSAVKCADKVADGWFMPDFDDSAWKSSYELCDVTVAPWARLDPAIARAFMTDDEWENYQDFRARAVAGLPEGLSGESEPDAHVVYKGWMPKISLNGRLLEPDFAFPCAAGKSPHQEAAAVKMASLGFKTTRISAQDFDFWKGEGQYDFSNLDWQARRLIKLVPDARLELFLILNKMREWCKAHPDDVVGYQTGPADPKAYDDYTQRVVRPSAASEAFREEAARIIAALGAFVRAQPWGKRVIDIRLGYGIYTEWHTYGMFEGPDSGPAMTKAFRGFLRKKYGSDDALAKAWGEPAATIEAADPPMMEERGPDVEVLDGARHRKALDFFQCNSEVSADLLLFMARKARSALPGRLVGAYYGYIFCAHPAEGANLLVDKVLASQDIDYLINPAAYTPDIRRAGGSYTLRAIPYTFHRYGKLCICEDDMRFHHLRRYDVSNDYATETPEESKATAKRNYLNRLFDGIGYQALDLSSGWHAAAFDDPSVLEGFHEAKRETAAAGDIGPDSGNSLAVVIDYRGRLKLGNKPHKKDRVRAIYAYAPAYLYRTGMTFDMMTLDDYLATKRPYRNVLFLNPDEADASLMAKARERAGTGALVCDGSFTSAEQYRALFEKAGIHAWTKPGSYVRHHGDLLMFHTAAAGRHAISLPAEFAGAVSLTTGRNHGGRQIDLETQGPHTELFRLTKNGNGESK